MISARLSVQAGGKIVSTQTNRLSVGGLAVGPPITVTVAVAACAQPATGVKVRVLGPSAARAGSKLPADTPVPDQVPVTPSCGFGNGKAGPEEQYGPPRSSKTGVMAGSTTTVIISSVAHCPGSGVKVSAGLPAPACCGIKLLPVTPGPLQEPVIPSKVAPKGISLASSAQKGAPGGGSRL